MFCKGFPPVQPQRLAGRPPVWYGNRRLAGYAKKGCLSGEIPARTAHQIPRPLLPPAGPAQRAGVHPRLHRPGGRRTVLQLLLPRLHGGDPRQAPPPRRHRRPLLPDPGDRRGLPAAGRTTATAISGWRSACCASPSTGKTAISAPSLWRSFSPPPGPSLCGRPPRSTCPTIFRRSWTECAR